MKSTSTLIASAAAAAALAAVLCGCAGSSMRWPTSQPAAPMPVAGDKPVPRVQDCININSGTPSKYVCNGKTYTSHELRKMREDATSTQSSSKS